jgi:dTDP-4-dehydrorhamnose 3,5-epimerase
MEFETTRLEGVILVKPRMFEDDRGSFTETWNMHAFAKVVGEPVQFRQSNESVSRAGVLRGMHFQVPPRGQGKLVRVTRGRVMDVAVDLRKGSRTFGQHVAVELSAMNRWQFWIPVGFAHGFLALEDGSTLQYNCTDTYHPDFEQSLAWDDPDLGIDWGVERPVVSERDQAAAAFATFESPF